MRTGFRVRQVPEGCEQGGPLAPALYVLAQHDGLAAASQGLCSGDRLAAFLDDLYVFTTASRAHDSIDAVTGAVEEYAGVSSNLGKTRVYSRVGGPPPPGIAELGPEVWRGDKPAPERGFVALGVPIGSPEFVERCSGERLADQRRLLAELPQARA